MSIDVLITFIITSISLMFLTYGYKTNNYKYKIAAIIFAVLYILSFAIIQIKKKDVDYFMSTIVTNNENNGNRKEIKQINFDDSDFVGIDQLVGSLYVLVDWFRVVLQKKESIFVGLLFYLIFLLISYYLFGIIDKNYIWEFVTGGSLFFTLIISIFIAITYKPKKFVAD